MKIVVFAPHSRIWQHAFPEALVAETLQQGGHDLVYVTCGRQFSRFCVSMSAQGISPQASDKVKLSVCEACDQRKKLLRKQFGLRGYDLADLIDATDEIFITSYVDEAKVEDVTSLALDGLQVGRYALYQLMLRRKLLNLEFTKGDWQEYLIELRNVLYTIVASRKVLERDRPDRVLVYNSMYSVNRTFCKLAEQKGIPHYFLHAGPNLATRLQTLMLARGDSYSYMKDSVREFSRFSKIPCTARQLALVTDHHLDLFRGQSGFVYSVPKGRNYFDLRARFGIATAQKILLVTMSSYDEETAAEFIGARSHPAAPLFSTQIEWLRALLDYVAVQPGLFLIIRVHPREFSNRREGVKSQHAVQLEQALRDLPANAAVNWPSDEISLYDLADQTDVVLNAWSSAGREMSLLGLPVVVYSQELPFYASELNYYGGTHTEYFACIERALREGWSIEWSRKAYRWGVFEFERSTVYIGDSYCEGPKLSRSLSLKIKERVKRAWDPLFRERNDCRLRRTELSAAPTIRSLIEKDLRSPIDFLDPDTIEQASVAEETDSMQHELKRLADALYPSLHAKKRSVLYSKMYGKVK
jgi:hypothetical protein